MINNTEMETDAVKKEDYMEDSDVKNDSNVDSCKDDEPADMCSDKEPDSSDGDDGEKDKPDEEKSETDEPKESDDTKYMRLAADFQNFKKRVEKEKRDIYSFANEKIAIDIIDVMDNFERAMIHSDESSDKSFSEGIQMIFKQMKGILDKHDILEIEAEGTDFDPRFHNAVMTEEVEGCDSGKVIQVLQKGYTLKGKVIRPSMVKVSQ